MCPSVRLSQFCFCFYGYCSHRDLHVLTPSVPTRRSSDLACHVHRSRCARSRYAGGRTACRCGIGQHGRKGGVARERFRLLSAAREESSRIMSRRPPRRWREPGKRYARSEEHTSELQSLMRISYALFCLKKKISLTQQYTHV